MNLINNKFIQLEIMKLNGYFKTDEEYRKALRWLMHDIVPYWFQKHMRKYGRKVV